MITILTKDHLKKLAADKVLAFELIKNNNDKIIGAKELDAHSISSYKEESSDTRIWIQKVDDKTIILEDDVILYFRYE